MRLFTVLFAACIVYTTGAVYTASVEAQESYIQLRKRINQGTVRIVTGSIDETSFRIGADMSAVLDQGDDLRILPMMGKGSLQNITDVLYLKGVDLGIIQSDVLAYVKDRKIHAGIERRLNYITKLYNEEFHLVVGKQIQSVADLTGKRVNVGLPGSGSSVTAAIVFQTLGVKIQPMTYDQALALELLKKGQIDGLVMVGGKPTDLISTIRAEDGVRLLSIPKAPALLQNYLPGRLTSNDYPRLIPKGETVDTVSVGAVLAVFAWKQDTKRYANVARFVDAFFTNISEFQKEPRHRKWSEISLQATVPGWTRFPAAEEWLQQRLAASAQPAGPAGGYGVEELQAAFTAFLEREAPGLSQRLDPAEKDELFRRFMTWFRDQ